VSKDGALNNTWLDWKISLETAQLIRRGRGRPFVCSNRKKVVSQPSAVAVVRWLVRRNGTICGIMHDVDAAQRTSHAAWLFRRALAAAESLFNCKRYVVALARPLHDGDGEL
jgi:hypothetical protein